MTIRAISHLTLARIHHFLFTPRFSALPLGRRLSTAAPSAPHPQPVPHAPADATALCEPFEAKAWPYDTALPVGLPPLPDMPGVRPAQESIPPHHPGLPKEPPPEPTRMVGRHFDTFA